VWEETKSVGFSRNQGRQTGKGPISPVEQEDNFPNKGGKNTKVPRVVGRVTSFRSHASGGRETIFEPHSTAEKKRASGYGSLKLLNQERLNRSTIAKRKEASPEILRKWNLKEAIKNELRSVVGASAFSAYDRGDRNFFIFGKRRPVFVGR